MVDSWTPSKASWGSGACEVNRLETGFYAGYGSLLLREIPYSCIQMPIYEAMKRNTRKKRNLQAGENSFTSLENAKHAMVAGGSGST